MLDEQQQMRNFTTRLSDGREVPDETAARLTVIGALKAVQSLHRADHSLDFKHADRADRQAEPKR